MSSRRFSDRTHSKWALFSGFTGSLVGSNVCALFFPQFVESAAVRPGWRRPEMKIALFSLAIELPNYRTMICSFCFASTCLVLQRIKTVSTLGSNRKLKLTGERVGYLKCTTQPNCCEKGVVLSFQTLLSKITHTRYTQHQQQMNTPASKCGLLNRVLLASAREDLLRAGLGGKHYRPS